MMQDEEIEYFHQLNLLCRSVSYSAESIIQLISTTRFPCNHRLPPEQPMPILGRWAVPADTAIDQNNEADMQMNGKSACSMQKDKVNEAEISCQSHSRQLDALLSQIPITMHQETLENRKPGFFPCKQCSEKQREHRMYLVGQILDAVKAGKIDLWDSELAKKQRLPENKTLPNFGDTLFSNDLIRWVLSGSLTNADLIQFCRSEKIRVAFKYDPSVEQSTKQESTNTSAEPVADSVPVANNSLLPPQPPGKMPKVGIGQLAIKVAWKIECMTGNKAHASKVIEELKEIAMKRESEILTGTSSHGVTWMTTTYIEKKYDVDACRKTLETWHKSRV